MESYKIQIKPSASKELELVGNKKDRQRIVSCIHSLADNPRATGCEKLAANDKYRVRQGNYRVVYSSMINGSWLSSPRLAIEKMSTDRANDPQT